jgi:hypothetical protein
VEATKHKEEKREKPKLEEQEGMPQHQHCPRAKHHGDRTQSTIKSCRKTLHEPPPHISVVQWCHMVFLTCSAVDRPLIFHKHAAIPSLTWKKTAVLISINEFGNVACRLNTIVP